ncbi:MAG TPA: hypothetical protein VGS28_02550 [Candidatus Saccharimonadales bacterium]|nr:hypothetical protein [Candidatus Saccharimonadales bacterium]
MKTGGETRRSKLVASLMLLLSFILVLGIANYAYVYAQTGSVSITGSVKGPAPSTPPTIDSPVNGSQLTGPGTVEVKGGCTAGLVVGIYRNNLFAGSGLCQPNGTFAIEIDLLACQNNIVAYQYNSNNQPSPPSSVVGVFYSSSTSCSSSTSPLIIEYSYSLEGIFVNQPFYLPIHFAGGVAPYAVSVDWGDGSTSVFSRQNTDQFTVEHTYAKAGHFTVVIQVADKAGHEAFMQFVLLVNGPLSPSNVVTHVLGAPVTFKETIIATNIVALVIGLLIGVFITKRLATRENA